MPKSIQFHVDGSSHIDPDTLAAFAEDALNQKDLASLFAHLAECERCREALGGYARLRDFSWSVMQTPRRTSAWPVFSYFGTAAGLACAVLCAVLILFSGREPQKQVASFSRQQDLSRTKHGPVSREPLSMRNESSRGSRYRLPSGKQRSSDQARRHEQTNFVSRRLAQRSRSPEALWRTMRFRTVESGFTLNSPPERSTLPGPFASARLDIQTSFRTALPDSPVNNQIAVRTTFGERRIYLSLLDARSAATQ